MKDWRFTPHATARRKEMGLTERAVVEAVRDAEFVSSDPHPTRRRFFGSILMVVVEDERTVVTVLWRSDDPVERPPVPAG